MYNEIDIVIPTLHRPEKLKKCIESIELANSHVPSNFVKVYIYYSDKKDFLKSIGIHFKDTNLSITPKLVEDYEAAKFWNTHLNTSKAATMMYLNDDVILDEFCIDQAYKCMTSEFYDFDGVIGIRQENIPENQAVKTAFGLIGHRFADRFPERKVFCEDYKRFYLDKELYEYSTSVNKFYFSDTAKLTHLHPAFDSSQEDATHDNVRTHLKSDMKTYVKRKELNYLWGADFNKVSV